MRYLRIIILFLILCNIPAFALVNFDAKAGSILSYLTFFLIIVYYFLNKKELPLAQFIILGLLYFFISSIVDNQNTESLIVTSLKYFIFVIAGASVIKDTKKIEIYILLLLGSLSIIYEPFFGNILSGRYGGFYLNPNGAGFACLIGFCISISVADKKVRLVGQILFSIAGFVTFSRTFLLLWLLINMFSLVISYKNIYMILTGAVLFSFFLSLGDKFEFDLKK